MFKAPNRPSSRSWPGVTSCFVRHRIMCSGSAFLLLLTIPSMLAVLVAGQSFMPYQTSSCAERGTTGPICEHCSFLSDCVDMPDGQLKSIVVMECNKTAGEYCNVRERGCSKLAGPCNKIGYQQNFICESGGVFPDPYDCQQYHMCIQVNTTDTTTGNTTGHTWGAFHVNCSGVTAFNPATGDCSLTTASSVCTEHQYQCSHVGDKRAWPGNDNIYYVCKSDRVLDEERLHPSLYRCGDGKRFNGIACEPRNGQTGLLPSPSICSKPGLIPHPSDCHTYYFCNEKLVSTQYTCPPLTHFRAEESKCVVGDCKN